jgi:hypothetical protein
MSQPWNVGTPGGGGSPPIGSGGQYYPGSPEDNALRAQTAQQGVLGGAADAIGNDIGSALADAFKGVAGPITAMFGIKEASLLNTLNELMNSAFYGVLALAGGLLCAWGLYEVGKDAGINVGEPVKAAAGVASTVLPVGRVAKAALGSRKTSSSLPKVTASKSSPAKAAPSKSSPAKAAPSKGDSGGREKAARDAGLGAAQILRGRREDAAAK